MITSNRPKLLSTLLAVTGLVAACSGGSGPLWSVPVVPTSTEPSVAQGSPDLTPAPSVEPSVEPTSEHTSPDASPASPSTNPSAAPSGTTIVRAYF